MARAKIGDDLMQLRLPDGTLERIDAISSNRSAWVREAVMAALDAEAGGGVAPPETIDRETDRPAPGLKPDAAVLLEAIKKKPMSSRQAAGQMGWLGLRYGNAEKVLLTEGLIKSQNGVLTAEVQEC